MVVALDATVWQSKAEVVTDALSLLCNVCAMGQTNVGHIQLPQVHQQTNLSAVCKNRIKLQEQLLKAQIDFSHNLCLSFSKESVRSGSDSRPATQTCWVTYSGKNCKWLTSELLQTGVLGPLPLMKVSDMEGYEAESRPGAAQRIEQKLDVYR